MAQRQLPTPDELCNLLRYEADTGKFIWRKREPSAFVDGAHSAARKCASWNSRFAGQPAGSIQDGYWVVTISGENYYAHRVAWAMHYGEWPTGVIDHISHDRMDNSISNLRDVSQGDNTRNRSAAPHLAGGVYGVRWCKDNRKWRARIKSGGVERHLGLFAEYEDAVSARKRAEKDCGYHENHGT